MNEKEFSRYCRRDVMELQRYFNIHNQEYIMRVLNKKYWPYHVKIEDNTGVKETWCYENFKSGNWRNVGTYFAFKRGEDATLFSLRWT